MRPWGAHLYKLRLHFEHLLPAVVPHVVPSPDPVFLVLRQVGVEPRRNWHHVGLRGGG